jgi:hypothetical protein
MRNNRHARATIIIVTIAIAAVLTSLFVATMTIAPRQADALSIYDPDEQDDYATTTTPIVSCAMDTIESLQSFLSCLGAK